MRNYICKYNCKLLKLKNLISKLIENVLYIIILYIIIVYIIIAKNILYIIKPNNS